MSVVDDVLQANRIYAGAFRNGGLVMPPARKLAVLACMDARLDVEQLLGLDPGDAHIIRNAGGIATSDAVRSLIISHYLLGTEEFMVINHTDCGMLTFRDQELRERLEKTTGSSTTSPSAFHAFSDLDANVRGQIQTLRSHPWIPKGIPIRGFIYNVKTGLLKEVASQRAAG